MWSKYLWIFGSKIALNHISVFEIENKGNNFNGQVAVFMMESFGLWKIHGKILWNFIYWIEDFLFLENQVI